MKRCQSYRMLLQNRETRLVCICIRFGRNPDGSPYLYFFLSAYLETTSIFLALLGNRPSHCKSQLFFLKKYKNLMCKTLTYYIYFLYQPFRQKRELAVCVRLLLFLFFPITTVGLAALGSSQPLSESESEMRKRMVSPMTISWLFLLWRQFLLQHWPQCTLTEQRRQRRCRHQSTSPLPRMI